MTTLVVDGSCSFCAGCVSLLPRLGLRVDEIAPYQQTDLARLGLTEEACAAAVQWVADDGTIAAGHRAIARLLMSSGGVWRVLGSALLVPPGSWVAAVVYRWVASNRSRLHGGRLGRAAAQRAVRRKTRI